MTKLSSTTDELQPQEPKSFEATLREARARISDARSRYSAQGMEFAGQMAETGPPHAVLALRGGFTKQLGQAWDDEEAPIIARTFEQAADAGGPLTWLAGEIVTHVRGLQDDAAERERFKELLKLAEEILVAVDVWKRTHTREKETFGQNIAYERAINAMAELLDRLTPKMVALIDGL